MPGLPAGGGLSRGSCPSAASAQKNRAKAGAYWRIEDFTVDKGKDVFFDAKIAHFRFYGNRKALWSGHL
jgi:hypothetical protein